MQLQIDSLIQANTALSGKVDSISKDLAIYHGLYTTIKDKVIKYDFDPAKMSQIIDSLRTHRDSTFTGLTAASASLKDTLFILNKENIKLKASLDSITTTEANKAKVIAELKELKGLLDNKIITQPEFDAKKAKIMERWQ